MSDRPLVLMTPQISSELQSLLIDDGDGGFRIDVPAFSAALRSGLPPEDIAFVLSASVQHDSAEARAAVLAHALHIDVDLAVLAVADREELGALITRIGEAAAKRVAFAVAVEYVAHRTPWPWGNQERLGRFKAFLSLWMNEMPVSPFDPIVETLRDEPALVIAALKRSAVTFEALFPSDLARNRPHPDVVQWWFTHLDAAERGSMATMLYHFRTRLSPSLYSVLWRYHPWSAYSAYANWTFAAAIAFLEERYAVYRGAENSSARTSAGEDLLHAARSGVLNTLALDSGFGSRGTAIVTGLALMAIPKDLEAHLHPVRLLLASGDIHGAALEALFLDREWLLNEGDSDDRLDPVILDVVLSDALPARARECLVYKVLDPELRTPQRAHLGGDLSDEQSISRPTAHEALSRASRWLTRASREAIATNAIPWHWLLLTALMRGIKANSSASQAVLAAWVLHDPRGVIASLDRGLLSWPVTVWRRVLRRALGDATVAQLHSVELVVQADPLRHPGAEQIRRLVAKQLADPRPDRRETALAIMASTLLYDGP